MRVKDPIVEEVRAVRDALAKARPNPYAKRLKRQITIRIDEPTIEYFAALAAETGIPYQM